MDSDASARKAQIGIAFAVILILAAAMRFIAAFGTNVDTPIRADAKGYVAYSYNWKNFGVYSRQATWVPEEKPQAVVPDALQQPGYPAFLRLFLDAIPDAGFVRSVTVAQACIGVVTVALVFVLSRLVLGSLAAVFVMALVAVSPHLIVMENYVLSETLFTALVVIFLLTGSVAIGRTNANHNMRWAGLAGAALGAACLVRPPLMQLAPALVLLTFLVPAMRGYRKQALCGAICFALVMSPWWARNLYEFGRLGDPRLLVNTLIHGSYPDFLYNGDPKTMGYPYRFDPRIAEIGQSVGSALAEIQRKFVAQPMTYLEWYFIGKIEFFFDWRIVDGFADVFTYPVVKSPYLDNPLFIFTHAVMRGLHWPLMIAGLLGAILVWKKDTALAASVGALRALRWQSLILANLLVANFIGAPYPRYSIPFRPLMYLLAVFAILVGLQLIKRHRERSHGGG